MCPLCIAAAVAIIAGKATAPGGFAVLVAHTLRKKNRRRNTRQDPHRPFLGEGPDDYFQQKEDRDGHQPDRSTPAQNRLARGMD